MSTEDGEHETSSEPASQKKWVDSHYDRLMGGARRALSEVIRCSAELIVEVALLNRTGEGGAAA